MPLITISSSDERFAADAYDFASKSEMLAQLGCVAVVGGKIVARGCNHYRTFSKDGLIQNCCSCHAEIDVLRKCKKQNINNKINLYISRRSRRRHNIDDKLYMNSTPCINCYEAMKDFNIKYIIFTNSNGELEKTRFVELLCIHETSGRRAITEKRLTTHCPPPYPHYTHFIK
uniref:CMP/dCMP-type deaminase domain-containing protein n=1 Tax=viral metagenome TaxID=1070528 RepID=A0A6C0JCT6_9ZZZZ